MTLPTLWLSGSIPSKKNSKRIAKRGGKSLLLSSTNYLAWEKIAILEIKCAWQHNTIINCESITYEFKFGDKRKRDLSNSVEGVNDALVSAGVLIDDNWNVTGDLILKGSYAKSKEDTGVLITFNVRKYED